MLHAQSTASAKRQALRARLASGELVRMPGAFTPLSAKLIEDKGIEDMLVTVADCLKEYIPTGVTEEVIRSQLAMYTES